MPYIGWPGVLILLIVLALWIIIVLPVIGFILYYLLAVPDIRIRH